MRKRGAGQGDDFWAAIGYENLPVTIGQGIRKMAGEQIRAFVSEKGGGEGAIRHNGTTHVGISACVWRQFGLTEN
jgi:hypothetical protein